MRIFDAEKNGAKTRSANDFARDCLDLKADYGIKESTVYSIYWPKTDEEKRVVCDMKTEGGGWTVCKSVETRFTSRHKYLFFFV